MKYVSELKFKDKCDGCGYFAILKGYHDKCFCKTCIKKYVLLPAEKQLSIYDMFIMEEKRDF